jgi:integrase
MGTVESYGTDAGRRWRIRCRTPDHRQTSKRGFRTKRDAEEYLAGVEVSKMRGDWVDPTRARLDVAQWAEQWFASQVQLKETTRSGYRYSLDRHVVPRWGSLRLGEVGHADVQAWVAGLSARLAPSTVRQIYLVLSGVMKYAVRDGRLSRNPCEDVRLPRVVKHRRGYLTHQQVAQLAAAVSDHGDVIPFLAYTGLRWGEMAALRVSRVDVARRRLDVVEAVSDPRGALVYSSPKSHERRSVPFPSVLTELLERRMANKPPDGLVFSGTDGGVLRNNNFRHRAFDTAVAHLRELDPQFPKVTPHDLRHTAASLAVSAGANVKAVQRMLGHASAAMTLDVYADLFDDDLDAVAGALDHQVRAASVSKMWPLRPTDLASASPGDDKTPD